MDRNGNAIASEPRFVRAVRGTVSGASCTDIVVQRSGYDTLVFAHGTVETRVPVIVATRPDSVGVVFAAQPEPTLEQTRFVGEDLSNPLVLALRPLVADIMAAYDNPTSTLDRVRAIRDWVARTAIHPTSVPHPSGSTSNLGVLPLGKTWADVNQVLSQGRQGEYANFWTGLRYDGYVMLDRLLGTLDPMTGLRAADGMMEHVSGARYRIRDLESYQYLECSFQGFLASALYAAAGLQSISVLPPVHSTNAVFIPELARWVYQDPTWNEEYLLDGVGEPLSPVDLFELSASGQVSRLVAVKHPGPNFDRTVYAAGSSYVKSMPRGMVIMGADLYRRTIGVPAWRGRLVFIDAPGLLGGPAPWDDPSRYPLVAGDVLLPTLGPVVEQVGTEDSVQVVRLSSRYPDHHGFERRLGSGPWEPVGATDVLPVGACRVEYRSVDQAGTVSASATLDVWVPRTEAFVQSAPAGSLRRRASYCVTTPIQ